MALERRVSDDGKSVTFTRVEGTGYEDILFDGTSVTIAFSEHGNVTFNPDYHQQILAGSNSPLTVDQITLDNR